MKYLKIVNNGLIEAEDLTLVGSSTKRGVNGKIGEFGSGNKFSLAWYERNGVTPTVFRGIHPLAISHRVVLHRDTPVKVITVDGQLTSITSTMGPKWTGWMALRETISNAIDEGGYDMNVVDVEVLEGVENVTTYYIPLNDELEKVIKDFDSYFSLKRTPSDANKHGEIFLNNEERRFTLYRQGIRCWDTCKKFTFDVNLFDISINESRLTGESDFDRAMAKFIFEGVSKDALVCLIKADYFDMFPLRFSAHNLEVIKELVSTGAKFGSKTMQKLAGLMGTMNFDYILPENLIKQLENEGIIDYNPDSSADFIVIEDHEKSSELNYKLDAFNLKDAFVFKTVVTTKFVRLSWVDDTLYINKDAFDDDISFLIKYVLRTIPSRIIDAKVEEFIN